jgi:predicted TIM-barrel fold metal-dependent hydrolase
MIIDAYTHCGLSKYLPVEDVLAAMDGAGVKRAVLCQHLGEYDNTYLARIVAEHKGRFAAVCPVSPEDHDNCSQLRQWHATGAFRGLRVLADWLAGDPAFVVAALDLGMNLVVYAPDGIAGAIPHLRNLLRRRPAAKIIISHIGNPKVENGRVVGGDEILDLASDPGIYVQLSGLSMFCEYPHAPLESLVSRIVEQFGPERITWGSNFPVCGDREAYRRDLALVTSGPWGLRPGDIEWVVGRTAQRLWFD